MTIETLNAIKSEAEALQESTLSLGAALDSAEVAGVSVPTDVDEAFEELTTNLFTIISWVNQAITDGTEEPTITAMQNFLNELKAVFDKYSAVLERLDGTGYGLSYGGADFFRVTVTDPVSGDVETKDIVPAVADTITSVDLA